jgi:hypothetical protein
MFIPNKQTGKSKSAQLDKDQTTHILSLLFKYDLPSYHHE